MIQRRPHRRAFLRSLTGLGAAGAGYLLLRQHLSWPTPDVVLARGSWSGWSPLPRDGGLISLPARIGGAEIQAVVDSGAQYTAIDAALAERLALPAGSPLPIVAFGVSGGPSLSRSVRLDAELGSLSITGLRAAALDLAPLSSLTRQPFSLLLGRDFLRAVVMQADYPQRRVAFFEPKQWTLPPEGRPVTVRLENGGLMAEVQVEDAPPFEVMVDTGATGPLALSEEAARRAGLLDGRALRSAQSVTLGGVSQDGMVRAKRVTFAGQRIDDVEVQIYRPAANAPVPDGLLGLGVLDRFHFAIDLPRGRLFLIGPPQPPSRRRRDGRRSTRFG